jgi:hypothetical protein
MFLCKTISILLLLAVTLAAQGKGKGKPQRGGASAPSVAISVIFNDMDRRAIQQWAQAAPQGGLPPGLAKRGELPPGLQKQLRRNGTLPPGLQKKLSYFPADLNRRLSPLPNGCNCDRVFVDGKALIVARVAGAILDAINVF